ncbi:hypothetical protein CFOL_v3_30983, partial [Cephalotus follicularis]
LINLYSLIHSYSHPHFNNSEIKLSLFFLRLLPALCSNNSKKRVNMPRAAPVLRKALKDLNLLKVLQSEINYELSSNLFQNEQIGSLGDFTVDWDAPETQDVFLHRKCEWGEDVAVSALLGPETFTEGDKFPREVLMKVCVKKSGLSSMLQFDCGVTAKGTGGSEFDIYNAYYLQLSTCLVPSVYRGPLFRLDTQRSDKWP